jgi:IS5 family transposase
VQRRGIIEERNKKAGHSGEETPMLIDRYVPQDVFAAVPPRARRTDPVLVQIDRVLEDEPLLAQVRADLLRRYPQTDCHGRYSTPVEVILRLLVLKHLYQWSFAETEQWVSDSLTLRWFSRVYFHPVPDETTLLRWAHVMVLLGRGEVWYPLLG